MHAFFYKSFGEEWLINNGSHASYILFSDRLFTENNIKLCDFGISC